MWARFGGVSALACQFPRLCGPQCRRAARPNEGGRRKALCEGRKGASAACCRRRRRCQRQRQRHRRRDGKNRAAARKHLRGDRGRCGRPKGSCCAAKARQAARILRKANPRLALEPPPRASSLDAKAARDAAPQRACRKPGRALRVSTWGGRAADAHGARRRRSRVGNSVPPRLPVTKARRRAAAPIDRARARPGLNHPEMGVVGGGELELRNDLVALVKTAVEQPVRGLGALHPQILDVDKALRVRQVLVLGVGVEWGSFVRQTSRQVRAPLPPALSGQPPSPAQPHPTRQAPTPPPHRPTAPPGWPCPRACAAAARTC